MQCLYARKGMHGQCYFVTELTHLHIYQLLVHLIITFIYNILIKNYKIPTVMLKGRKEMFYLMMYSTHFIYGYMASDA